jgi:hypothetical protein
LLGAFICWQLFFLFALNYTQLRYGPAGTPDSVRAKDRESRPPDLFEEASLDVQAITQRWAQLTGQYQAWWLFAVPLKDATFPLVELHWQDEQKYPTVRIHAFEEPSDPAAYFHAPAGDRLLHYEMNLALVYNPWDPKELASEPDFYLAICMDRARDRWQPVLAYVQWRLRLYQREHPDAPLPTEVRLYNSVYSTPPLGASWRRPAALDYPIFRWRPDTVPERGFAPLEVFDPRKKDFIGLALEDSP